MNIQEPHPPSRQDRRHRASHRFLLTTTLLAALLAATASHAALTLDAVIHHDPALPGEALQLDLTVANTDGVTRTGVVLEMVFPAGLDQLFETTFLGDCPSTSCSTGETVTWTLGSLPPGGHVTVEVPAVISNGAAPGLLIVFSPTVNDDSVDADSDLASVTVDAGPRFDLAMGEDSDPVAPGDLMTWKISWGFRSDAAVVTEAELTFPLPPGTTFVSASDAGNSDGLTVTWPLGFVAPGESGIREVTVEVDGGLVEGAFLEAVAQLINVDTPSEMATARTGTVIASSNGLSLVIESNTNPGRQDEYVNLNAFVTNNDPFTHFGVTLTARHPQDMAQLFESSFAGDCPSTACEANEQIRWSLGDLPAGGSVSVYLPGRITAAALDGVLVNLFMASPMFPAYRSGSPIRSAYRATLCTTSPCPKTPTRWRPARN